MAVGSSLAWFSTRVPETVAEGDEPVLARVERRSLQDAVNLDCSVERRSISLQAPAGDSATQVITAVPDQMPVKAGHIIAELNGRPYFFLSGDFPLYRSIQPEMKGPDVRTVQDALTNAGFAVPVTGTYDTSTQAAVTKLYRAAGYSAPTAGGKPIVRQGEILIADTPELAFLRGGPVLGPVAPEGLGSCWAGAPSVRCTGPRIEEVPEGSPLRSDAVEGLTVQGLTQLEPSSEEGDAPVEPSVTVVVPPKAQKHLPVGGFEALIVLAESGGEVLVVPGSALGGTTGNWQVTVVRDGDEKVVPVDLGVESGGFVAVTPKDPKSLSPGDTVVVGQW